MLKTTAAVLIVNLAGIALNLLLTMLLARFLGPDGFGSYTTLLTLSTLIGVLLVGGLPNMLVREVVAALHDHSLARMQGLFVFALVTIGGTTVIAVLLMDPVLTQLYPNLGLSAGFTAMVLALSFWLALAEVASGYLQGLHRLHLGRLIAILRPAFLVVLVVAAAAVGLSGPGGAWLDDRTVIGLHTLSAAAAALVLGGILLRQLPAGTFSAVREICWRPWSKSWFSLLLERLAITLQATLPILMLGALSIESEIGLFRIAERTAFFASFGLTAVGMALRPQIAQMFRAERHREMRRLLNRGAWLILLTTFPVVVALLLAPQAILRLLFGEVYGAAAPSLVLLAISQAFNAAAGLTTVTLVMTHREWVSTLVLWLTIGLTFCLGFFLIPEFGGYGAAMASASGLVFSNIVMLTYLAFAMRIPTTILPFPRPRNKGENSSS